MKINTAVLLTSSFLFLTSSISAFAEMEAATPESQGVDSQGILDFVDAAEREYDGVGTKGRFHGFVIVRHGKVIAEGSWKPFDTLNETHMLYSHSKSFTSSAIGFLADEGKIDLDERVLDLFPNEAPADPGKDLAELRVRDLLTMNVGCDKDHQVGWATNDWVRTFFTKPIVRRPGTGFKYDSDATYMLAAIVEKKSGMKMMDYLKAKMFDKIGITSAWTTYSPEGIPCGGWGMNMTTRDLARFGLLYLQHGRWEGEQILSPDWVQLATARQTWSGWKDVGVKALGEGTDWEQGYGFQFWRCTHGAYRADGAAGQLTVILPEQDMVVSVHAGLNNMQKEVALIWDHLIPACKAAPLPENAALQAKLKDRLAKLEIPKIGKNSLSGPFGFWIGKYELKDNRRGIKSVEFIQCQGPWALCAIETPAGMQQFRIGDSAWHSGKIRIDTPNYESLGAYIGEHKTMASGGLEPDGSYHARAYLTGTTGFLDFVVTPDRKLKGRFWAMGGCPLESK